MRNTGTEWSLDVTPIQHGKFSWVSRTTFANVWSQVTATECSLLQRRIVLRGPVRCAVYLPRVVGDHRAGIQRVQRGLIGAHPELGCGPEVHDGLLERVQLRSVPPLHFDRLAPGRVRSKPHGSAYYDATQLLADTLKSQARLAAFGAGYAAYLQPAGFVKFRELTISYALPKSLIQRWNINAADNIRIQVSGRNLWTWTKYAGYDPEVSNFSDQNIGRFQDVTPYPPSRSVFFSILANF